MTGVDDWMLDELIPMYDPAAPPRVLSRGEALALGYSRSAIEHRLSTGRWRRVLPRVYLTGQTFTWPDRQAAALAFAGPQSVLSGAAALTDRHLRSVTCPTSVLVLVPGHVAVRSVGWVRVRHTARTQEPARLPGPRRAPLARAVADLALERDRLDDVRALVAEAVRRNLCSVAELADELAAGPRRGSAHLRRALNEVTAGAWSSPEARAAGLLRRAGVAAFEQNARINLPNGRFVIVDFLWRSLRAVLEIDSREHHGSPPDADATVDRHIALETLGYSVIHYSPAVVIHRPEAFTSGVAAWLRARQALSR